MRTDNGRTFPAAGGGTSVWRVGQRHRHRAINAAIVVVCIGLVLAGIVGTVRYVTTFWLYRGFAAPKLAHSVVVHKHGVTKHVAVVPVTVQQITITSPAIGGYADTVVVVLPPGYASDPARRYPVLYLLHGVPGNPQGFITIGDIGVTEAELIAAGKIQPMILVMPTGGRSYFSDQEWANGIQPGNDWETFVAQDLVNTIDARYRTIATRAGRGIGGLSEGGYGALNIGLHHPGEFALLESWSGYMQADDVIGLFGHSERLLTYNSPADTVWLAAPQLRAEGTYIWFFCGADDPLKAQNQAFDSELDVLGIQHYFFTWPGKHSWGLWRTLMPEALITASEHLSHG